MAQKRWAATLGGLALFAVAGCAGKGLPDAGPAPGQVEVGFGSQEAEKVTGAVKSLGDKDSGNAPQMRLEEMLRGRIAGLVIWRGAGGRPVYRLRGATNSILYDQEPLFVIDGIQTSASGIETALAGLLPKDIRQVDVLKDIASTSIYGSRGAGGVILITTRR